jgi:dephospho-CoA kinase
VVKIGITGGIGSGKSVICAIIEHMGFPVFYSDKVSKQVLETDRIVKEALIELVGTEVYSDNRLDKKVLARTIFNDGVILEKVNQIVHPRVQIAFEKWCSEQNCSFVFNEAAILFETGSYQRFDTVILVVAPEHVKIERVMKRDGVSEQEVLSRMSKQWMDDQKIPLAAFVIENDNDSKILEQLESIFEALQCAA